MLKQSRPVPCHEGVIGHIKDIAENAIEAIQPYLDEYEYGWLIFNDQALKIRKDSKVEDLIHQYDTICNRKRLTF